MQEQFDKTTEALLVAIARAVEECDPDAAKKYADAYHSIVGK